MNFGKMSVHNPLTVNLLTFFVLIIGLFSCVTIQKEAFPPISFEVVTIRTAYPGASPEVVEKFVTIKIEDELKTVDGLDEITSVSAQNISLIAVKIDPDNRDQRRTVNDIQRAVDRVKDLPIEVNDLPVVTEIDAEKFPVITISLSGLEYKDLQTYAKMLEDRLLNLSDVGSVAREGYLEPEIWVEVNPDKAKLIHVSLSEIMEALRETNVNLNGGTVNSDSGEMTLRTNGEFATAEDVGRTIIRANDGGKVVRVTDVANIRHAYEDSDRKFSTDGRVSINLMAVKKPSGDILNMVDDIKSMVKDFQLETPAELQVGYVDDFSYFVKRRLNVLVNNGIFGAVLILCFLFLVLAPPIAAAAALDIPMTFLITVFLMKVFGISINLMSMFGMIMVIGMLVDDAIIMAENVFRHIEKGGDPRARAIEGAQEVMKPITASVLTSICAYLPLALMSGIIGKYVRAIPIVVGIALTVSWVTTVFAIPTHAAEFSILMKHKTKANKAHWFDGIRDGYVKVLRVAMNHRYWMAAGIFAFFVFTIVFAANNMKFVLFTSDGMDEFYVRGEAKIGTTVDETSGLISPVERAVAQIADHELENYTTEVGLSRENAGDPNTHFGSHLVQIHVYLTPAVDRKRDAFEIIKDVESRIQNIEGFEELSVENVRPGPPVGKAVEIKVRGDSFEDIMKVVNQIKGYLKTLPGALNISDDFEHGKDELNMVIDRVQSSRAQLSYERIARELRNAFEGGIATTIQKSDEEIDVRVMYPKESTTNIDNISKLLIPNDRGNLIPLGQIAKFEKKNSIAAIKRFDRKRMVQVSADADEDISSSIELNKSVMREFKSIQSTNPGIELVYGGEQERTQESMTSLLISFIAAMFMIFCVISIQFKSLIQPPIVMLTIPLGLVGVIWALYFHGKPFGFLSIMGFIGLSGVVVNDSIVLIDFMNRLRRSGMERRASIEESCKSRFRAVIMTSLTTVAGTMPMAYGWGGDDPFIKSMALAFTWGMAFASTITLFAIPCFYAIVDDISVKIFKRDFALETDSFISN
ncbi:MAG: multidrug efflux pump subunit AcrB [Candidatus Omnitrophota bacterium]|jgi:multidrug efflux pump subunit AcrB